MGMKERVMKEIGEKTDQLRRQYMADIRPWIVKEKGGYINFFRNCPQSGRYASVLIAGVLIGMML